jgi:hypothetical protein
MEKENKGALLYDLWEMVHKLHNIYDFDSTMSADDLIEDLRNIIKTYIQ